MTRFARVFALTVGLVGVGAGIAYATIPPSAASPSDTTSFGFRVTIGQRGFQRPFQFQNGTQVQLACLYDDNDKPTAVQIRLSASGDNALQFSGTATTGKHSDAKWYNAARVTGKTITSEYQLSFDGVLYDNNVKGDW